MSFAIQVIRTFTFKQPQPQEAHEELKIKAHKPTVSMRVGVGGSMVPDRYVVLVMY